MKIEDFKTEPLQNGKFIKTALSTYKVNDKSKSWEVVNSADSVAILIYHKDKDAFIFVRQFRAPVYIKNNNGMTLELCAGLIDKDLTIEEIASEEIEEECGYRVDSSSLQKISSFFSAVGFAGSRQTLFYAEVDDSMKVGEGGGIDDEDIEVIEVPISKAKNIIYDENIARTPGLMFAILWWLYQR